MVQLAQTPILPITQIFVCFVTVVKYFLENTDAVRVCCCNSSLREAFIKCVHIYSATVNTPPK
jgi:hypothetical protein